MSAQKAITFQSRTNLSGHLLFRMETGKFSSPVSTRFTITKVLNSEINDSLSFNGQDEYLPIIPVRKSERYRFIE